MATFYHGSPLMVDYTPGADVAVGEVVVINGTPFIAHLAIAANTLGALAALGGVYKDTPDAAIPGGSVVYWDGTQVTETALANNHLGYATPDGSNGGTTEVSYVHNPAGLA